MEMQIELPPAPSGDGQWWAQVQVREAGMHPFTIPWMARDLEPEQLGDSSSWFCLSAIGHDENVDLNVRVRFCRLQSCLHLDDEHAPESHFHLEHPFYIGRRTYWRTTIPSVPQCNTDTDCSGTGQCVDGSCLCQSDADCCPSGTGCSLSCNDESVCVAARCDIEGCIEGESSTFCRAGGGEHFCENGKTVERRLECGGS